MPADPKSYQDGFTAGWLAASRALMEAMAKTEPTSVPLAMAGAAPARSATKIDSSRAAHQTPQRATAENRG